MKEKQELKEQDSDASDFEADPKDWPEINQGPLKKQKV